MNRTALILVALAVTLGASGCGEKKEDTGSIGTSATQSTAPQSATDTTPNPPDGGISDKPGGSSDSGGNGSGGDGSGGIQPPQNVSPSN